MVPPGYIRWVIFTQGAKCAHHENGHGGKEGFEEEKEKLGDNFRHHPIYKLALGQVGRIVTSNVTTNLIVVWSGSDCGLGPVGHHHLLQRRPPRSLHPQWGSFLWSFDYNHSMIIAQITSWCPTSLSTPQSSSWSSSLQAPSQGLLGISASRWLSPRLGTIFLAASALASILAVSSFPFLIFEPSWVFKMSQTFQNISISLRFFSSSSPAPIWRKFFGKPLMINLLQL